MCAIIAWSGIIPKGLITRLLLESEHRGFDATGIAFQSGLENVSYKLNRQASQFVKLPEIQAVIGQARKSVIGIAHTRRASPGMPTDEFNAHPFGYWQIYFAHNGRIENWTTKPSVNGGPVVEGLKQSLIRHFSSEIAKLDAASKANPNDKSAASSLAMAQLCLKYCQESKTDSRILGPFIHGRNFSNVQGSLALVWMQRDKVYTYRHSKEAVSATILWNNINEAQDNAFTLVASTKKIITESLTAVKGIEYEIAWNTFDEGTIYSLNPAGMADEGKSNIDTGIEDEWSSKEGPVPCLDEQQALNAELQAEQQN